MCHTTAAATTAGSPAKRAHLRGLGLPTAADSRSCAFADVATVVSGGVDLVLNSLTSPGTAPPGLIWGL